MNVAAALRLARDTATSRRLVGVVRREMAPTPEAVA